ncbi:cation-transporting P-type ATPase [Thiohalorhabdus sp.]|uniref:cation-transporting P-type ATPase n=1 Tax=Thiohalorhabdus sp. TaxID=3094134 RepID=UPI002FC29C23
MAATEAPTSSPPSQAPPWHAREPEATLAALDADGNGLSTETAQKRRARYGPNRLTPAQRRGPIRRFLAQFHNVLIYLLLGAAAVTGALAHWVDTGVILGVVVINAIIGFIQEGKAERALDAIRDLLSPRASVLRSGRPTTLPAEELVPGDIVLLQAGDKVPADLRLLEARNLHVEEASLTGESLPVAKDTPPVAAESALGDRKPMAFSGTLVTSGQGRGVAVATGDTTQIGRISAMLGEVTTLETPLLQQMDRFGRWLSAAIVALAAGLFAFGTLGRSYPPAEMFLASVGLAVAAIPEGLPAIITITLAVGVQVMARRQAIIRLLPAVETLGSVSVICSDKTGTLTRNEMTVASVITAEETFGVSGSGYDPHGGFSVDGAPVAPGARPTLAEVARAGLLCNDASVEPEADGWHLEGDPTEGALVTLARKADLEPELEAERLPRTDTIPFESEHRFMATLHHDHTGHGLVLVKGAPERILAMCSHQRRGGEDEPLDPAFWHRQADGIADQGQRVLALASKPVGSQTRELQFGEVEGGLTLLGLAGMLDPPREDAIRAVAECRSAGIRVKMITGDHAATARAVGRKLGIGDGGSVLTGPDLDAMGPAELAAAARDTDVFARVGPGHKLQLVEALQDQDRVVAVTGDGVNDAPALKRANVGIAMGRKGTEVAKEAAEMVLGDDNFASIAAAVREGRTTYDNIKKSILFILPTNGGEALTIMAAIGLGRELPITPVQILWVNMITAVTLALALAFEPTEAGVMRRLPRDAREPVLSRFLTFRIAFVSLILVTGTFGLFLWERMHGAPLGLAQTVAVNTLVAFEVFYLLNTRRIHERLRTPADFLGNRYAIYAIAAVIALQMLFTYAPVLQHLFGTTALDPLAWGRIVGVAFTVFILIEAEKAVLPLGLRHLPKRG